MLYASKAIHEIFMLLLNSTTCIPYHFITTHLRYNICKFFWLHNYYQITCELSLNKLVFPTKIALQRIILSTSCSCQSSCLPIFFATKTSNLTNKFTILVKVSYVDKDLGTSKGSILRFTFYVQNTTASQVSQPEN